MNEANEAFQCPVCRSEFFTPSQTEGVFELWHQLGRVGYDPAVYIKAMRNEYQLHRAEHKAGYTRILGAAREHWDAVLGQDFPEMPNPGN